MPLGKSDTVWIDEICLAFLWKNANSLSSYDLYELFEIRMKSMNAGFEVAVLVD